MPQMSPILWLNLYLMFIITLMIFIAVFFYTLIPIQAPSLTRGNSKKELNWKW